MATTLTVTTALIVCIATPSRYRLIYNPSQSAPRGWYWQCPAHSLEVNDYALALIPPGARELAAMRHYLPWATPLLKRVGAVKGQWICYRDGVIWIDWRRAGFDLVVDAQGRPLSAWKGCAKVKANEYFLLSASNDASFDSRYFGPIAQSNIVGEAIPLWTWQ